MLNSLSLASTLVESADESSVAQLRKSVSRNTIHMNHVLDDLALLSSILSRSTTVKITEFSPTKLLGLLCPMFEKMARDKGLGFTSFVSLGVDKVCSDEVKVRQIVENLVSNAVKYTRAGEVHVRCESADANRFAVIVQDTGLGIAEQDRQLIFSEDYSVNPESPLHGLGLGLAIVSGLVDMLGGSIELKSEKDKGSEFRVILPRVAPLT